MSFADFVAKHRLHFRMSEVSAKEAQQLLTLAPSKDLLDETYTFGARMVDEVMARTAQIDAKATNLLGWSSATLAFLLLGGRDLWRTPLAGALTSVTVLLAFGSIVQAGLALRVYDWYVPSEVDWFRKELFGEPVKLRVYHVLGMLETHQHHNRQNMTNGEHVRRSQWLLVGAAVLLALLVVVAR